MDRSGDRDGGDDRGSAREWPPALIELVRLCESRGLRCRWTSWREGDGWRADVQAGEADAAMKRIGTFPFWRGGGATEQAALANAARSALLFWRQRAGG